MNDAFLREFSSDIGRRHFLEKEVGFEYFECGKELYVQT
jgi:hypothetical protein